MPPATEQIKDKASFDVYAMLLILSGLFTGGAAWMLYDDLDKNWHYTAPPGSVEKATHITRINDDPEQFPDNFNITKTDLDDWKLCPQNKDAPFPVENFEWPTGYNPLKNAIKGNTNNLTQPADQLNALMGAYKGSGGSPEKPDKVETPKPPEPPKDAPKTDAPTPKNPADEKK